VNKPSVQPRGPRRPIAPPVNKGPSKGPRGVAPRGVTPRSPREDGVNRPSVQPRGPRRPIAPPVGKGPQTPRNTRPRVLNDSAMAAKKAQEGALMDQMARSGVIKPGLALNRSALNKWRGCNSQKIWLQKKLKKWGADGSNG
jgi:hypothetical protein